MMTEDMSPIPAGVGDVPLSELEEARREATLALLEAEKAEKASKIARKQANWKIKQYERLVQEHAGQMRFPL